jgi:hypothetical protein
MKNSILIFPEINMNVNLAASMKKAQDVIVSYFGKKFAVADNDYAFVKISTEITQEDIDTLNRAIDLTCIKLVAVLAEESSDRVCGDIIDLR